MTRAEQKEKRRWDILNVALDLFITKGYAATKTKDIANALKMSEGLLFHYFETKEKLYLELINIAVSGKDNVKEIEESEPILYFEKVAKTILEYIVSEPFAAKLFVLMNDAQTSEAVPNMVKQSIMRKSDFEHYLELIKKGQEKGQIKEENPVALCLAFWFSIQGIAEQLAKNSFLPCPNSDWIVDIIRKR